MKNILKLIRIENLIFIIIIQYAMRFLIINPILANYNLELLFSEFNFALLVLSTIILAASGYIINDHFDAELDRKAGKKVIIDKVLSKKSAMNLHIILNIIAIAIGFYISYTIGIYKIGFIFIIIAGLLWFYSSSYKKMFLVGNLIISILAGLVPFIIILFEIPLQYDINKAILLTRGQNLNEIIIWLSGFSLFAFILTLIREIIKDTEDAEGDNLFDARTMPIVLGIKNTKIVLIILILATIGALGAIVINDITNLISDIYIVLLIIFPLFFTIYKIFKAKITKDFHFLSTFTKLIMFSGVLYSIVAYFNF